MWQTVGMRKILTKGESIVLPGVRLCLLPIILLTGCGEKTQTAESVVFSERPVTRVIENTYVPQPSRLGVRLRVDYDELVQVIEASLPASQTDTGKKKVCKKLIGFKTCSTVVWDYALNRTGSVSVSPAPESDRVRIAFPFEFAGTAGLKGELAKALGLDSVDFDGALDIAISTALDLAGDWCPQIAATVDYQWSRSPRVEWAGGLDFNVKKLVDDQLQKKLKDIDKMLASSIDCQQIREEILANWQPRSMALDLDLDSMVTESSSGNVTGGTHSDDSGVTATNDSATVESASKNTAALAVQPLYLNLSPLGAAFSGVKTEAEALGFTLQLESLLSIDADPVQQEALTDVQGNIDANNSDVKAGSPVTLGGVVTTGTNLQTPAGLPELKRIGYESGDTHFSLLVRAPYKTLGQISTAALRDKDFRSDSAAGEISVRVTEVTFSPAGTRLGIALKFDADLPTSQRAVNGEVYLTAQPKINASGTRLSFEDLEMTKLIDSVLWNSLATLFEGRILQSLQRQAQFDLTDRFSELEIDLLSQLSDPERTRGARVNAEDLRIRLQDLFTESEALALVLQASTKLDVELPFAVFEQQVGQ